MYKLPTITWKGNIIRFCYAFEPTYVLYLCKWNELIRFWWSKVKAIGTFHYYIIISVFMVVLICRSIHLKCGNSSSVTYERQEKYNWHMISTVSKELFKIFVFCIYCLLGSSLAFFNAIKLFRRSEASLCNTSEPSGWTVCFCASNSPIILSNHQVILYIYRTRIMVKMLLIYSCWK